MKVCKTITQTRQVVAEARAAGRQIVLVPTMGALHEGHLSLIRAAAETGGFVVVSIFVNPTQFGPGEDLDAYPRPIEQDLAGCESHAVDLVFLPSVEEMYPKPCLTEIHVAAMTDTLCGRSRPGHFAGVCTVVSKLLNITLPDVAIFGQKDYQQVAVLRRMVADLNMPVEIRPCPTVREADGLAMSSRNAYLSGAHRSQAPQLQCALQIAAEMIRAQRPQADQAMAAIRQHIQTHAPGGEVDYIEAVDPETLQPVESTEGAVLLALAVRFGSARLIDNLLVDAAACSS